MTYTDALLYLDSFINFEKDPSLFANHSFKLERMQRLCEVLGNPERDLKIIHVAGSKGKGSTCAMLAHILKQGGYRTGLYTSPHIDHYRERIRILDKKKPETQGTHLFPDAISKEALAEIVEQAQKKIEQVRSQENLGRLTFYEVFTALMFLYFKKEQCDWVVLETGLGGRLDATNVCSAQVAVITTISLEHTQLLGDTLGAIAREKAGIIKGKEIVVVTGQSREAEEEIRRRCAQLSCAPQIVSSDKTSEILKKLYVQRRFPLKGKHQHKNALTVLAVLEALRSSGCAISEEDIAEGLRHVFWPIRFEQVSEKPVVLLDGAHDALSMTALLETIREEYPNFKIRCVFGVSEDKDRQAMSAVLNKFADVIIATKAEHPRGYAFSPEELDSYFPEKAHFWIQPVAKALMFAVDTATQNDIVVVAGSIFVAAEARRRNLSCTPIKI